MNETEIRERLRDAVGEAHYPSVLKSKVESRLRDPAPPGHPRLVGLVAAVLAVVIVGSLVFIRLQSSTGFLPAAHPQTRPSSAPTVPPSGTLQSIGRLPVEDLAVANLSQAADAVSTPDLLQTSSGRAVRLVGAYADTARIVLILRSLPPGQPMVQISDDSGPINSGYGEANGVIGDLVVSYMQPPRAGADGVAHLGVTVSNFVQGPPAVGSANSGVWSFSVSLKIQPAIPLTLSPTLTSVGSWKVTVEKFELTPSVVHLRAAVDGPSSIDVNQDAFTLLDDAGNPINVAGASFVPKGGQKSTQVDMSWGRVFRATTYRQQSQRQGWEGAGADPTRFSRRRRVAQLRRRDERSHLDRPPPIVRSGQRLIGTAVLIRDLFPDQPGVVLAGVLDRSDRPAVPRPRHLFGQGVARPGFAARPDRAHVCRNSPARDHVGQRASRGERQRHPSLDR